MLLECFGEHKEFFTSLRTSHRDGQQNKEWSTSLILNRMEILNVGTHVKRHKIESKKKKG